MEHGTGNTGEDGRGFKGLRVWRYSDDLASLVFRVVSQLPARHQWLASQMARCAVSVPANIAEGYGRGTQAYYLRFLDIARGSLAELEYYIHFVGKEQLVQPDVWEQLFSLRADTGRLLHGLWQSLKSKPTSTWDHTGSKVNEDEAVYEFPL